MEPLIYIEHKDREEASILLKGFFDNKTKRRVYINALGAELVMKYLSNEGINTSNIYNMHNIFKIREEFDVSDVILPNIHIDVRMVYDEEIIFIPKSHFEFNLTPDIYVIFKMSQDASYVSFLGFISPNQIDKSKQNTEYYFVDKSSLTDPSEFISYVKDFKGNKTQSFSEDLYESAVALVDNDINDSDKKALFEVLKNSSLLREEMIEFDNFEWLSYNASNKDIIEAYTPEVKSVDEFDLFDEVDEFSSVAEKEEDDDVISDSDIIDAISAASVSEAVTAAEIPSDLDLFADDIMPEISETDENSESSNIEIDNEDAPINEISDEIEIVEDIPDISSEDSVRENANAEISSMDEEFDELAKVIEEPQETAEESVTENIEELQEEVKETQEEVIEESVENAEENIAQAEETDEQTDNEEGFAITDVEEENSAKAESMIETEEPQEVIEVPQETPEDTIEIVEESEAIAEESVTEIVEEPQEEVEETQEEVIEESVEDVEENIEQADETDEPIGEVVIEEVPEEIEDSKENVEDIIDGLIKDYDEDLENSEEGLQEVIEEPQEIVEEFVAENVEELQEGVEENQEEVIEESVEDVEENIEQADETDESIEEAVTEEVPEEVKTEEFDLANLQDLIGDEISISEVLESDSSDNNEIIQDEENSIEVEDNSVLSDVSNIEDVQDDVIDTEISEVSDEGLTLSEDEDIQLDDFSDIEIEDLSVEGIEPLNIEPSEGDEDLNENTMEQLSTDANVSSNETLELGNDDAISLENLDVINENIEEVSGFEESFKQDVEQKDEDASELINLDIIEDTPQIPASENITEEVESVDEVAPIELEILSETDKEQIYEDSDREESEELISLEIADEESDEKEVIPEEKPYNSYGPASMTNMITADRVVDLTENSIAVEPENHNDFLESLAEDNSQEELEKSEVLSKENSIIITNSNSTVGEIHIDINDENDEDLEVLYDEEVPTNVNEEEIKNSERGSKAVVLAAAVAASFIIAISGSYYFMMNNNSNTQNIADTSMTPPELEPKIEEHSVPEDVIQGVEQKSETIEKGENTISQPPKQISETDYLNVSKLGWAVPDYVTYNKNFTTYLQSLGKSLRLSLNSDLLLATEYPYTNEMHVSIELSQSGSVSNISISKTSGSKEIDGIVLRTVKSTIDVLKPPSGVIIGDKLKMTLKIYL